MGAAPQDLVAFGRSRDLQGRQSTLTAAPGPDLSLRWGTLALADPGRPDDLPTLQVLSLGAGTSATTSSTASPSGDGDLGPVRLRYAASVGRLDEVTSWQPAVAYEQHVHLDSRSGFGAFYDVTDTAVLRPLLADVRLMEEVRERATVHGFAAVELGGRVVAAVFSCPAGPGSYPAYAGYDVGMGAVAVLVDLLVLDGTGCRA